jgi:tetratricopeptide (TPR) repeat protein
MFASSLALLLAAASSAVAPIISGTPAGVEGLKDPPAAAATEPVFDPLAYPAYFTDKDRVQAVQELNAGRAGAALRLLPKNPTDAPTRFVRAQALAGMGENAAAAKEFEALANTYPALSARSHCEAAAAYEGLNDSTHAVEHWKGCADDPAHSRSGVLAAARHLIKLNRGTEALELLAPLRAATGWGHADALYLTAQIQESAGQANLALETYRTLYAQEALSPVADRAREPLNTLAHKLKVLPLNMTQAMDRIDKLIAGKQTQKALQELEALKIKPVCVGDACKVKRCHPADEVETDTEEAEPAAPTAEEAVADPDEAIDVHPSFMVKAKPFTLAKAKDDEDAPDTVPEMPACVLPAPTKPAEATSCRAQMLKGWAQSLTKGTRVKAIPELRSVYAKCGDPDIRARALFYAAAAGGRIGDHDAFDMALITALQFPTSTLADDALLLSADRGREDGDGHAERQSLRLLVNKYKESEQRAEALFRLYWSHRAEGRPGRGLQYLDSLSTDYENGARGDGGDAERGRYWWGRTVATAAVKADRPDGVAVLAKLAHDRPTTYYGLLARSFISSIDPNRVVAPVAITPYPGLLRMGRLVKDRAFQAAIEFWRLGETKEAHDALLNVDLRGMRADGALGEESTLIVTEMLQRLGDQRMAHALTRRELLKIIREGSNPLGRRAAMVCYPLAFRNSVSEHATEAGFAPDFLQGLMREESALDPMAKSPVGARGLTQLMPATAMQVARSLGIRKFSVGSLWEPDTNIRIGSVYLGRMLKQFGHPGLAAAAYNAGPGAVARWLLNTKGAFDEFVEQIPFLETRGYVKRVLRSYAAYAYLYESTDDKALRVSLFLPATVTQR